MESSQAALARIKSRIDIQLNDYLCEMKPDYDDSITGFNEAWTIVSKILDEEMLKCLTRNSLEPR